MKKSIKIPTKPYILITIVILFTLVAILSASYAGSVERLQKSVHEAISHYGLWAPILYTAAYVIIGLTGFSVTILSLVALGVFDSRTAFFVIVIGASLSAAIAFLLARSSSYDIFEQQIRRGQSKKLILTLVSKIEDNLADKPFRSVLVLRFTRMPYIALSYAAGFVPKLPFRAFMAATIVSNGISALAYVLVGTILLSYIAGLTLTVVVGFTIYYVWSGKQKKDYSQD